MLVQEGWSVLLRIVGQQRDIGDRVNKLLVTFRPSKLPEINIDYQQFGKAPRLYQPFVFIDTFVVCL
jgi:hypothetical protein